MQIHKNICKNVEKYMKKCYVRVENRTPVPEALVYQFYMKKIPPQKKTQKICEYTKTCVKM